MINIKIKRIKVRQSQGKSVGSNSFLHPNIMNGNTVLEHRTKIDAHNNSEPLIERLSYV